MTLYRKIESDMREALKKGEAVRLSALRMLISAIKTMEIEKNLKEAADPDVIKIIQTQIKQHRESIAQFEKGNRPDLAGKEKEELTILESYMPKQLTEEEVTAIVKEAIASSCAVTKQDMGKVMKLVMEKAAGRADGKMVNQIVMKLLK
jgi:uncharacterized protein YqeY